MSNIGIGIIGYGYWGQNLVRNFYDADKCTVVAVADPVPGNLSLLRSHYPAIAGMTGHSELIHDPRVHAVVIATPVTTHYAIAKEALLAGKHVLIEKPMTTSVEEAEDLRTIAMKNNLVIMVDHTFLYTAAVMRMKELIGSGTIGLPRYFDSTRINLGLFQPDVNVLWDLASHDIAILLFLIDQAPLSVNATGISHTGNGIENIAYLTINYASDLIAHIHCSWTSPVKIRQTLIGGDKQMIIYNDLEPTEKVRIYDTGFRLNTEEDKRQALVDYRTGDIVIPRIRSREALSVLAKSFIDAIDEPVRTMSPIDLMVVRVLSAAQVSIKNHGKQVMI